MEEKKPDKMIYKDPISGQMLYGFSQTNLDKIYRLLWVLLIVLIIFGTIFCVIVIYTIYKIEAWNIVGKFLAALRG